MTDQQNEAICGGGLVMGRSQLLLQALNEVHHQPDGVHHRSEIQYRSYRSAQTHTDILLSGLQQRWWLPVHVSQDRQVGVSQRPHQSQPQTFLLPQEAHEVTAKHLELLILLSCRFEGNGFHVKCF